MAGIELLKEAGKRKAQDVIWNTAGSVFGRNITDRFRDYREDYMRYKSLAGDEGSFEDYFKQRVEHDVKSAVNGKIRNLKGRGVKRAATLFAGEDFGKKATEKAFDIDDYSIVNGKTGEYLAGRYKRNLHAKSLGDIKYKGKDVWGAFWGNEVFYTSKDYAKQALGSNYETSRKRTKLSEDAFNQAWEDYIRGHEVIESGFVDSTGEKSLSEDRHGKFEAYFVKSLWEHRQYSQRAAAMYAVAREMNRLRIDNNDELGQSIKKYITPDVQNDLAMAA